MNRPSLSMCLVSLLPLLAGAAASAQVLDKADAPELVPVHVDPSQAADMVFETMEHNFGLITDSQNAEFIFKFTNQGKGTLRVASTKGSCSCTVPALSKQSFEPGESGEIRVIYDPSKKSGSQTQTVTVNTNDAETPVILLRLSAHVLPEVLVKPKIGHFNEVPKDTPAEIELQIFGRDPAFEVTGYELSDPELFSVEIGPTLDSEMIVEGVEGEPVTHKVRECKVKVHMNTGQEIGLIRNKLLTLQTNHSATPSVQVELMAQHMGDIDMIPRRISLGALPAGAEFHKEVTIKSLSGTPFKVLGIEHSSVATDTVDYAFQPVDPSNPTAYKITVSGTMPEDARVLRGRLLINTDMDREQVLYLHYYGQLRPATTTSGR